MVALGQGGIVLRIPTNDKDATDMANAVANLPFPADSLLSDALQDAKRAYDYFQGTIDGLSSLANGAEATKKKFNQDLDSLRASAQNCGRMDVGALKASLTAAGGSVEFSWADQSNNPLTKFSERKKQILLLGNNEFCAELVKPEVLDALRKEFEEGVTSAAANASDQAKWTSKVSEAWNQRIQKLSEASRPALKVTDNLVWLVLLLGVFGCGFLLLVKAFGDDIQMELITSGQIIQFPTVVILLVVLVILGLSQRISDNTLSALLGGVAGYVLSQGVGRATAREAERRQHASNQPPPQTPTSPPNTP
jgi:hypothetical protein